MKELSDLLKYKDKLVSVHYVIKGNDEPYLFTGTLIVDEGEWELTVIDGDISCPQDFFELEPMDVIHIYEPIHGPPVFFVGPR